MAKFCGKCGARMDENTSLCPNCDAERIKSIYAKIREEVEQENKEKSAKNKMSLSRVEMRQKEKAVNKASIIEEKEERTYRKKEDKAARTFGQKVKSFFLKLLLIAVILVLSAALAAGLLVYFDVIDIPVVSEIFEQLNIKEGKDSYISTEKGTLYTPDDEAIVYDEKTGIAYVNNIVIIFFKQGTEKSEIDKTIKDIGGKVVGSIPGIDQYQVEIEPHNLKELKEICESVSKLECVETALYDNAIKIDTGVIPNDPWDGLPWSEEKPSGDKWWAEAIDAPGAWDYNDKFSKIKIGIIDDGFDTDHEDLKNKIAYTSPASNKEDHGTHVAGIIGANANNKKGITGLVWNGDLYTWDWKLSAEQKELDDKSEVKWNTTNQILGGTVILVEKGAQVINLSAGNSGSLGESTSYSEESLNSMAAEASAYLGSMLQRKKDFLIVQSAGNGNGHKIIFGIEDPISVDAVNSSIFCSIDEENCSMIGDVSAEEIIGRIVVVGAAERCEEKDGNIFYRQPQWSNAGPRVDICAPGVDIYSTTCNSHYERMQGTSMAAPIVTGVAALTWSANLNLSGSDVKKIICADENTDTEVQDNKSPNHPLDNVYRMVNAKLSVEAALKKLNSDKAKDKDKNEEDKKNDTKPVRTSSEERDIVLVIDKSGSMYGTPMEETKKAAEKFVDKVLEEDASIGVVAYSYDSECISDFSTNKTQLKGGISSIYEDGGTNIEQGLYKAHTMLSESGAKKKLIVLMSDGEPNQGKCGEELISYADEIKREGIMIYTLGFFQNMGTGKSSAQVLMERIASTGCHYEVANSNDLVYFFGDVADQINGQKYIYIRIACPVDVSVSYNGEMLTSDEQSLNLRTDFGTLSFENEENTSDGSQKVDDRIKVLRLKEGVDYDVEIVGTGRGIMNYTIGFMDEEGEYSDLRRFGNIKVTRKTVIDTVAEVSDSSVLNIDEDGDGKYDRKLMAGKNELGKEVKVSLLPYVVIGILLLIIMIAIIAISIKIHKNRRDY